VKNKDKFENKIYDISRDQDLDIARLKLESMDIKIDTLTEEQNRYIHDYGEGT